MKGYRFYLEFKDNKTKRKSGKRNIGHAGNCLAVPLSELKHPYYWFTHDNLAMTECFSAVMYQPNSPVCGSNVSFDYLSGNCKRVSERTAREIHPRLFEYLEA